MDIGTERYLEGQRTKRAVKMGLENDFVIPCERCASTLVINHDKSENYFRGRDSDKDEWRRVMGNRRGASKSIQYFGFGGISTFIVCEKCSAKIQKWSDKKVKEEYENWPIEVRG